LTQSIQNNGTVGGNVIWQFCKKVSLSKECIIYFPISSELKNADDESHDSQLLQESGFLTLLDFIHRGLKAKKDEMLASQITVKLMLPLNEVSTDLCSQQHLLQIKSHKEIQKIQDDLNQKKLDFAKWERDVFQQEMQYFQNEFECIKNNIDESCKKHEIRMVLLLRMRLITLDNLPTKSKPQNKNKQCLVLL
jgi:hypothetical protein